MASERLAEASRLDLEFQLGFLLHDTTRLRHSALDRYFKPLKLTRAQCGVLAELSREDGVSQSQLAASLDLGKVAVGDLIDRLEKNGLVRRSPSPDDRRLHLIHLAPKSKRLLSAMREATDRFNTRISAGITYEQLLATGQVLERMKRNLRDILTATEAERRGHGTIKVNIFSGEDAPCER